MNLCGVVAKVPKDKTRRTHMFQLAAVATCALSIGKSFSRRTSELFHWTNERGSLRSQNIYVILLEINVQY